MGSKVKTLLKPQVSQALGMIHFLSAVSAVILFWELKHINNWWAASLLVFFVFSYLFHVQINKKQQESVSSDAVKWERTAKRLYHDVSNHLTIAQMRKDRLENAFFLEKSIKPMFWEKELISLGKHLDSMYSVLDITKKLNQTDNLQWQTVSKPIFLEELVDDLFPLFSDRLIQKSLKWKVEIPKDMKVSLDKGILRDCVLTNLISNAIKFSDFDQTIVINATIKNRQLTIKVIDSGCGMTKNQIENSPCYSRNKSSKGTGGELGSGLGFPLIHEAVEYLGGTMTINSPLDKNTSKGTMICLVFNDWLELEA